MLLSFWHAVFFDPIYNALILILGQVPGGDVGLAIALLTIAIKLILLPLSLSAAKTQRAMRTIEPELEKIKEKYKDNREKLARAMMDLYKEAGIRPFASIFLVLIQLPVIIALYLSLAFGGGVPFPDINTALLYSFVPTPDEISMLFLGLIDMAGRSLPLAILAGLTQFLHTRLALPPLAPRKKNAEPSFKDDFTHSMQLQMRYVLPVIIGVVAYTISAAIALYFLVSNLMAIGTELVVRRNGGRGEKKAS